MQKAELDAKEFGAQMNPQKWPELKDKLTAVFKTKTRDEWCAIMEGSDVCFAPVLSINEAPDHAHNKARGTFVELDGVVQPAPAPRFSRTKAEIQGPARVSGQDTYEVLKTFGYSDGEIEDLKAKNAIRA